MDENQNLPTNVDESLQYRNFNNICKTMYGIHGEVRLWASVKQDLLWLNKPKYQNCSADFGVSFPRRNRTVGYLWNGLWQSCPTFLYIEAHLTDGCGGAGGVWRLQ
jgi:hypothetical protein